MGPFHVNNTFGRHLGRHLDFSELPKDARVNLWKRCIRKTVNQRGLIGKM